MNPQDLIKQTRGKWFRVEFTKRDGSLRVLVGRTGVTKHVTGKGMSFNPAEKNLQVVFEPAKKSYRCFSFDRLISFRCGDLTWRRAQ